MMRSSHVDAIDTTEQLVDIPPATVAFKQTADKALWKHYNRLGIPRPLLMLGPGCTEIPNELIADPVLEPVDKIVGAVIIMLAREHRREPLFPSQPEIARLANVAAKDTIWRALLLLRCTRWLTVFESRTFKGDRMRSIGFAINANSLGVADTLYLDPYYVSFLEKAAQHSHMRVRNVACHNLRQLPEVSIGDRKYYPSTTRPEF